MMIVGLSLEIGGRQRRRVVFIPEPIKKIKNNRTAVIASPPIKEDTQEIIVYHDVVVQFAFDYRFLTTNAQNQLAAITKELAAAKDISSIMVDGHASSEGQVHYNEILSQHRAQAVSKVLTDSGVSKDKIIATGFGAREPIASNKTEAGRILNRRAEFVVKFTVVRNNKGSK